MTLSFEFVAAQLRPLGEHQDLALASRALPDGAYTTLRTYRGRVLRLGDHARRAGGAGRPGGRGAAGGPAGVGSGGGRGPPAHLESSASAPRASGPQRGVP